MKQPARPSVILQRSLLVTLLALGLGCRDGVGPKSWTDATSLAFDSPTIALVRGTSPDAPTATVHVTALDAEGDVVPPPPEIVVTSSDPSVVYVVGSVGEATYKLQGMRTGTATITASFPGLPSTSTTVNVVNASPPATSLTLTPSKSSIYEGEQFSVTGTVRDGSGNALTDRPIVFTMVTTNMGGSITATSPTTARVDQPLGAFGTRTVRGQIPEGLFTDLTVAVIERRIVAYEVLNPSPLRIAVGAIERLNLAFRDSTGLTIPRGRPNLAVAAAVDQQTGATIATSSVTSEGPNGITEVSIAGQRAGSGALRVTLQNRGNPIQFDVPVVVFQPAHIELSPSSSSIAVGATKQLAATVLDDNGVAVTNDPVVGWNSSNVGIASVNGSGLVTGVAPGTVTITATSQSGRRGTAQVTVTP